MMLHIYIPGIHQILCYFSLKEVSELSSAGDRPAICRSGREVKHVHMKEHASESRK